MAIRRRIQTSDKPTAIFVTIRIRDNERQIYCTFSTKSDVTRHRAQKSSVFRPVSHVMAIFCGRLTAPIPNLGVYNTKYGNYGRVSALVYRTDGVTRHTHARLGRKGTVLSTGPGMPCTARRDWLGVCRHVRYRVLDHGCPVAAGPQSVVLRVHQNRRRLHHILRGEATLVHSRTPKIGPCAQDNRRA